MNKRVRPKFPVHSQILLEHSEAAANARNRGGATPLFACAAAAWRAGAAAALRAGALCRHPDIPTSAIATPAKRASLKNIVRKKSNALHIAAFFSYPKGVGILKYLLENADVNVTDLINSPYSWHHGPIHRAIVAGPEPVKMLLGKRADVRLKIGGDDNDCERWFTPLRYAAMAQNYDAANIILGYDRTIIDEIDAMGRTPLFVELLNESNGILRAIIRAGGLLSSNPKGLEKQSAVGMITDKLPNPTSFSSL